MRWLWLLLVVLLQVLHVSYVSAQPPEELRAAADFVNRWKAQLANDRLSSCEILLDAREYTQIIEREDDSVKPVGTHSQRFVKAGTDQLSTVTRQFGEVSLVFECRRWNEQVVNIAWRRNGRDKEFKLNASPAGAVKNLASMTEDLISQMWDLKYLFGYYGSSSDVLLPDLFLQNKCTLTFQDGTAIVRCKDKRGEFELSFEQPPKAIPKEIKISFNENVKAGGKAITVARKTHVSVLDWTTTGLPLSLRTVQIDKEHGGEEFVRVSFADMKVQSYNRQAGGFELSKPPPEETTVIVNDMPYECVWRNGQIRPAYSAPSPVTLSSKVSSLMWIVIPSLLIGGSIILFRRMEAIRKAG